MSLFPPAGAARREEKGERGKERERERGSREEKRRGKETMSAKGLIETIKQFIKNPWKVLPGPVSSSEWRAAVPNALEYRSKAPQYVNKKKEEDECMFIFRRCIHSHFYVCIMITIICVTHSHLL